MDLASLAADSSVGIAVLIMLWQATKELKNLTQDIKNMLIDHYKKDLEEQMKQTKILEKIFDGK